MKHLATDEGARQRVASLREQILEGFRGARAGRDQMFDWSVPRYARALNLTESRLNRLCQALTARSAFDVVQDRLLLEARRKLLYIAAPMSQLAYELDFADPAHFRRFFKKRTGIVPSTVRRQRGKEGSRMRARASWVAQFVC